MRFVEHYTGETPESLHLGDKLQREADAARRAMDRETVEAVDDAERWFLRALLFGAAA